MVQKTMESKCSVCYFMFSFLTVAAGCRVGIGDICEDRLHRCFGEWSHDQSAAD